jgi:hypothetical protein
MILLGDLGHFELEQPLDELRVRPREDDLHLVGLLAHFEDQRPDALARLVRLARNLLAARQEALRPADVHQQVAALDANDRPRNDRPAALVKSSKMLVRSRSRVFWMIICLAVCAAMRPSTRTSSGCRPPWRRTGPLSRSSLTCASRFFAMFVVLAQSRDHRRLDVVDELVADRCSCRGRCCR